MVSFQHNPTGLARVTGLFLLQWWDGSDFDERIDRARYVRSEKLRMDIYAFTEIYPNPYRPYLDTQFVGLARDGHDLRIFAEDAWETPNEDVAKYGLLEDTRYYPSSIGAAVRRHFGALASSVLSDPAWSLERTRGAWREGGTLRRNLSGACRALLLPRSAPDVCVVHDYWELNLFLFLPDIYPSSTIALYWHGGAPSTFEPPLGPETAFSAADLVFTNTRASARDVLERGCPDEKIRINPVGFDLRKYERDEARRRPDDGSVRFISAGRLVPEKGLDTALEALARLRETDGTDFLYRICGSGPERDTLEALAGRLGILDRVQFLGHLSSERLIGEMGRADVLLLPSIPTDEWKETQACVVQEAMLVGCLPVTSRIGGVPESIPREMHGFSFEPGDVDALAGRIEEITRLEPDVFERLAERCREFAAAKYDISILNQQLLEACEDWRIRRGQDDPTPAYQ